MLLGYIVRFCQKNSTWESYSLKSCISQDLSYAAALAEKLNSSTLNTSVAQEIFEIVNISLNKDAIPASKDIKTIFYILKKVSNVFRESQAAIDIVTLETVVTIFDQLLVANTLTLVNIENEAATLLESLEIFASAATKLLTKARKKETLIKNNIAVILNAFCEDIVFESSQEKGWINQDDDEIYLPIDGTAGSFNYSLIFYKNLAYSMMLNRSIQERYNEDNLLNKTFNSKILSIYVTNGRRLSKPVKITFSYLNKTYSEPICSFLNTSVSLWSTRGCTTESITKDHVTCTCSHLTNFAVLMSPVEMPEYNLELSIISIIGCSVSLCCLVLTLVTYLAIWKYIKSDRSVLHMNLSLCLIIGYIVFLSGIDRTEDKVSCIVVAVLLHFFFLAVFFIMLAEGIEILKSILFVFTSKSILYYLLAGAFGIPFVIVCVSLAVTKSEGYGNNKYCWLSIDDGLVWAFLIPMIMVFLANLVIFIKVIRTMQTSQMMKNKYLPVKVKSALRSLCILSPILGLAWIFGVLSVNKESVVFQYLFAILNSLQGLFIFIFHCILQKQVQTGLKETYRKYKVHSTDPGQTLSSTSKSVQHYFDSKKSKIYNVKHSSAVSEKVHEFPLFHNAVFKSQKCSTKSCLEKGKSNSGAEDTSNKKPAVEYKKQIFQADIHTNIETADLPYVGYQNNDDDFNFENDNTLVELQIFLLQDLFAGVSQLIETCQDLEDEIYFDCMFDDGSKFSTV
ncbi:Adhesion G-protein coupled receptor D1 [Bulinus truncatus]|nr:Adhesion G-protein coupled receptor D1 [Bulinus truncatus]